MLKWKVDDGDEARPDDFIILNIREWDLNHES